MLREVTAHRDGAVREPGRRWWADEVLDLIVWQDPDGTLRAFQLAHRTPGQPERALHWDAQHGARHSHVDAGEARPGRHKSTPLLVAAPERDGGTLVALLEERAGALEPALLAALRRRLLDPRPTAHHGRVVAAGFDPPFWLGHRHLQTVLPNAIRRRPRGLPLRRERVELPDGDFVDVDWLGPDGSPIVVVLHGLEGSIESPYAASLLRSLSQAGYRGALLHFRGCSGEPNRLPRAYHSGDTAHLEHFLALLAEREPEVPRAAVGYSLGGNALLKWLGESGDSTCLTAAVAVSVPFDLGRCAEAMDRGFSRVYQRQLIARMQRNGRAKARVVAGFPTYPDHEVRSFRRFDDKLTAPLHGFHDAADYYARCSSRRFLRGIRTPTLIIHAADDPFMDPGVVPTAAELAPAVTLELAARGGHVGFIAGPWWRPHRWVDRRVVTLLRQTFE